RNRVGALLLLATICITFIAPGSASAEIIRVKYATPDWMASLSAAIARLFEPANQPVMADSYGHANQPVRPDSYGHANQPVLPDTYGHANQPVLPDTYPHANQPVLAK